MAEKRIAGGSDGVAKNKPGRSARQYAGENTLLVVAGLGSTGGLRLNAFSFASDRGIAVLGPSATGAPAITWSTGPIEAGAEGPLQTVATRTDAPEAVVEDSLALWSGPSEAVLPTMFPLSDLHALIAGKL